jgi:hypothetical protein
MLMDKTFERWMAEVNHHILQMTYGMAGVEDLADQPYHDHFAWGTDPEDVASILLEEEGFPF